MFGRELWTPVDIVFGAPPGTDLPKIPPATSCPLSAARWWCYVAVVPPGSGWRGSTMAEITPTRVSLWIYERRQRTNVLCAITPTLEWLSK